MFCTLSKTNFYHKVTFILLSAIAFSFQQSKLLLFCKECTLYHTNLAFNNPDIEGPRKQWKKLNASILNTSIIFSTLVKKINFSFLAMLGCLKFFEFGLVYYFVLWYSVNLLSNYKILDWS